MPRTLATIRASPARFRAPGGRGGSGEAKGVVGLSRGAPGAANRRRWWRHYGGHAEELGEGLDPGFAGEMRGREGGEQVGGFIVALDHQGAAAGRHGRRPARRHGASAPWHTVVMRFLLGTPCEHLINLQKCPPAEFGNLKEALEHFYKFPKNSHRLCLTFGTSTKSLGFN